MSTKKQYMMSWVYHAIPPQAHSKLCQDMTSTQGPMFIPLPPGLADLSVSALTHQGLGKGADRRSTPQYDGMSCYIKWGSVLFVIRLGSWDVRIVLLFA
jgi:hypothetical protein